MKVLMLCRTRRWKPDIWGVSFSSPYFCVFVSWGGFDALGQGNNIESRKYPTCLNNDIRNRHIQTGIQRYI